MKQWEKISRINAVLESLKQRPQKVNKVFIQKDLPNRRLQQIVGLAKDNNVPFIPVPRKKLLSLDKNNQGVVALISPIDYSSLEEIISESALPFLLILDGVEDPRNIGAIIRSAACAGADGIIIQERRSSGITGTVAEVSAGGLEHIKISREVNLVRAIKSIQKRGIWVVGAESGACKPWYDFDYTQPVAVVFGSEGKGLRPLVKKNCDVILSLPIRGTLSSLNVSAAAAIFLYEVVRQRQVSCRE